MRAVLLALVLAFVPGAGAASIRAESWYDAEHGWAVANGSIRSTEDGGRTWRRLAPGGEGEVIGVLRTGLVDGLYYTLAHGAPNAWWTNDNGRTWTHTNAIGGGAVGSGSFLFWTKGGRLYRVQPWPFRGRPRLTTLHSSLVLSARDGGFANEAIVPGGLVTTFSGPSTPSRALVIRWLRRPAGPTIVERLLPQPAASRLEPCQAYLHEPVVSWPVLVIPACRDAGVIAAVWRSVDGGASWTLAGGGSS